MLLYISSRQLIESTPSFVSSAKSQEVEKWKAALNQENNLKHQLEQQLTDLNEKIVMLEMETQALKEAKTALETESSANQEQMTQAFSQLRNELSNKAEEMNLLKEHFDVVLANKDGTFYLIDSSKLAF